MMPPSGTPNSVMRESLDPQIGAAEAEADRLSAGIRSGSPDTVRRQMGGRLGTDFSSVRFHSDPQSVKENEAIGARAYTRGSDIYFGRGGFDPSVAAHELVHTVQQHAVPGCVSRSVPAGTVQREADDKDKPSAFANVVRKVILMNRFKNRLKERVRRRDTVRGTEAAPAPISRPEGLSPDPAADSSLSPTGTNDTGSSTHSRPVTTQAFNGLSVLVDGDWTDVSAAEAMFRSRREQAASVGTVSSMDNAEPDPDNPPRTEHEGSEVVRDAGSGLWVEKAGQDLFVYLDGQWLAAREGPAPVPTESPSLNRPDSETGEREDSSEAGTVEGTESSPAGNGLPDEAQVFGTGWRWRMSRKALTDSQINGMVAYYKEYARQHHNRVFADSPKIVAGPIQSALSAANDSVGGILGDGQQGNDDSVPVLPSPAQSSSPQPEADADDAPAQVPGVLPGPDNYHELGDKWKTSKWHTGNAVAAQNIGVAANAFGRQGVLLDNYQHHVTQDAKDKLDIWDKSKWTLPTHGKPSQDSSNNIVSQGDYDPYVNYVAPIAGTALGIYGAATGFTNMVHGINDTIRLRQNVAAGASRWDAAQSGLDTVAATSSTMSSIWNTVQSIGNIGGAAANTFGNAADAIPGLSIVTGAANAASGTIQAIRGRKTRSELNSAGEMLDQIVAAQQQADDSAAPAPAAGQLTDQEKLQAIMKQGHQTAVYNMWSGGLKAAAGGLNAAAGISTLAGAAPVGAGLQGLAAVLNLVKFTFERAYKSHMRNSIVGQEFDIDWKQEMKDVRKMIDEHNKHLGVRDKDVREIILKAHGSTDATRTAAYNTIKLNRARYLISTAINAGNAFHTVAEMVIEAMGVHKVGGNNYAAGADRLLAEKLG
ncbi:MAG: DUF4157 domain-containing protein [Flexilinea sp.]|nr:DUF4157 domain-containing protein [Flexilinea sp.]